MSQRIRHLVGLDARHSPLRDRLASGLGGLVAIVAILFVSRSFVDEGAALIVASMGASAVLLFAVPHGPLSQPWQLVVGHLVSAVIGVACARWLGPGPAAAGLAVGAAILAMRLTHSIHPPGGATALSAVLGGPAVIELGFQYVVTPVLLNVAVILAVGVVFNYPLRWRRYPAALAPERPPAERHPGAILNQADLVYALSEMDTFVDVSEHDLQRIFELAVHHASEPPSAIGAPAVGHCYSNGRYGADWQVREVLEIRPVGDDGRQVVTFRIVAGAGRRQTGRTGLLAFRRWARHEVVRNENSWLRPDGAPADAPE